MKKEQNIINNRAELFEKIFGEPTNAKTEHLSRIVYKNTDCGEWMKTTRWGVRIGIIVEGSEAEFDRYLRYPFTVADWYASWAELETLAQEAWEEANGDE